MTITIPFPPSTGNHTTKCNHKTGRFFTVPAIKKYRLAVACDVKYQGWIIGKPHPIRITMVITPPDRRRRDSGNLIKVVYDALTRCGFWADDSLVREEHISWAEPAKPGHITLEVEAL